MPLLLGLRLLPAPFLKPFLAAQRAFDAAVQKSLRVQPVDNAAREVVLRVLEDGFLFTHFDERKLRRGPPRRTCEVADALAGLGQAHELKAGLAALADGAIDAEHDAALWGDPVFLGLDARFVLDPGPDHPTKSPQVG